MGATFLQRQRRSSRTCSPRSRRSHQHPSLQHQHQSSSTCSPLSRRSYQHPSLQHQHQSSSTCSLRPLSRRWRPSQHTSRRCTAHLRSRTTSSRRRQLRRRGVPVAECVVVNDEERTRGSQFKIALSQKKKKKKKKKKEKKKKKKKKKVFCVDT